MSSYLVGNWNMTLFRGTMSVRLDSLHHSGAGSPHLQEKTTTTSHGSRFKKQLGSRLRALSVFGERGPPPIDGEVRGSQRALLWSLPFQFPPVASTVAVVSIARLIALVPQSCSRSLPPVAAISISSDRFHRRLTPITAFPVTSNRSPRHFGRSVARSLGRVPDCLTRMSQDSDRAVTLEARTISNRVTREERIERIRKE